MTKVRFKDARCCVVPCHLLTRPCRLLQKSYPREQCLLMLDPFFDCVRSIVLLSSVPRILNTAITTTGII